MNSGDIAGKGENTVPLTQNSENEPSKFKTLGFAALVIFGIGGLIAAGMGAGGLLHAGSLTNLGQASSIIMIVIGDAGGIPLLVVGVVGFINTCSCSSSRIIEKPLVQGVNYYNSDSSCETKPMQPKNRKPPLDATTSQQSSVIPQTEEEERILNAFLDSLDGSITISHALQKIPKEFFDNKSQERARYVFSKIMDELFGATTYFPQAGSCENLNGLSENAESLDLSIFQVSTTQGVEEDIPKSSKDTRHVHVYQVASQCNGAEAAGRYTPAIGTAMQSSSHDYTQGPLAQRTNPEVFECVTAFLTHLGFNMLQTVLPCAGQTYQQGALIEHGYLCPTDATIGTITQEFKENFSEAEYVCYSSFSEQWGGSQPVYIMLQAAPAIGYSHQLRASSDELQKHASLANYLAFFRQGIAIAKATGKPVVLHVAAVGGGVFRNTCENLQWGFTQAALALQKEMKSAQVSVQLEAFCGRGLLKAIAAKLNIPKKNRIGDLPVALQT